MTVESAKLLTKDLQKTILKKIFDFPTLTAEELALELKATGEVVSIDEVNQAIRSISPSKNWHRAQESEILKEKLNYIWTLELQVLFLLSGKQKENTYAEFNHLRLQQKLPKVSKDLIRHIQSLLLVEGKGLNKFRKFEKERIAQGDIEATTQSIWAILILLKELNLSEVKSTEKLNLVLAELFKEKFSKLDEKIGKTLNRLIEKITGRYFRRDISEAELKEQLALFQSIYDISRQGEITKIDSEDDISLQLQSLELLLSLIEEIKTSLSSSEAGILGKVTGKSKNNSEVEKKLVLLASEVKKLNELNEKINLNGKEMTALSLKLQSDYDEVLVSKRQLEDDINIQKEEISSLKTMLGNLKEESSLHIKSINELKEKENRLTEKESLVISLEEEIKKKSEQLDRGNKITINLYKRLKRLKLDLKNKPEKIEEFTELKMPEVLTTTNAESLPG